MTKALFNYLYHSSICILGSTVLPTLLPKLQSVGEFRFFRNVLPNIFTLTPTHLIFLFGVYPTVFRTRDIPQLHKDRLRHPKARMCTFYILHMI